MIITAVILLVNMPFLIAIVVTTATKILSVLVLLTYHLTRHALLKRATSFVLNHREEFLVSPQDLVL